MLDETDDLQYAVAQVLTEVTGSPDWHEGAALQVKDVLGEDAASSPLALVEAAAREGLLSAVRVVTETKHGGPGPHDSGTPQSVHGSWAERLGRAIGLPDDLIDVAPDVDAPDPDRPRIVAEGPDEFIEQLVNDFLPDPDPIILDMTFAKDVLEDEEHPLHKIAAQAAYLIWGTEAGDVEDMDSVYDELEMLEEAFDSFEADLADIREDHPSLDGRERDVWSPVAHDGLSDEDRDDVENRLVDAVDQVHSAYLDLAARFPDHASHDAENDYRYGDSNRKQAVEWARHSGYSINKTPYDKWDNPEGLAASTAAAQELKHATATALAKALTDEQAEALAYGYQSHHQRADRGAAYAAASSAVGAWAQSSNDKHAPSLLMQDAAAEEFGLHDYSDWHTDSLSAQGASALINARKVEDFTEAQRALLREMYASTQQHLKDAGITHLLLHRGQSDWDGKDRPMSSWSMDEDEARNFTGAGSPHHIFHDEGPVNIPKGNVVRHRTVPAEQVLCFPGTGFGCLNEFEVVVLANLPFSGPAFDPEEQLRIEGSEEWKHAGPGPHPGTGTPQSAHGSALGPAMKRLTKMLADPDWRFVRHYGSTPQPEKTAEEIDRARDLQAQGKDFEALALAETRAYKEFFDRPDTPDVRVERVEIRGRYNHLTNKWDEALTEPVVNVIPDPEGTRIARLPSRGKHYGLHAIWDDEKGEIVGWRIDDPYTYDTEFETNPAEIERTKHLLDTKEKFDLLHSVIEKTDLTPHVRRIARYEPEGEDEERAKRDLLRLAGRVQRGEALYVQPIIDAYHALGGLEYAQARPDEDPDPDREDSELDDLLGMSGASDVPKREAIRASKWNFVRAGEKVSTLVIGGAGDEEADPASPVLMEKRVTAGAEALKAHVAEQVAKEWEAQGYPRMRVGGMMERAGSRGRNEQGLEGLASDLVRTWAETSNDEHDVSLAVQDAAAREFVLSETAGWHKEAPALSSNDEEVLDSTLRSMYERTQRMFEEQGITELRLHRGQSVPAGWRGRMRPLSSWSVDRGEAGSFAGPMASNYDLDDGFDPARSPLARASEHGAIFSATVPASRVLCTPKTGFGCLGEYEVVLLGGPLEGMVEPLHGEAKHLPGRHPQATHGNWATTDVPFDGLSVLAKNAVNVYQQSLSEDERTALQQRQTYTERAVPVAEVIQQVMADPNVAPDWETFEEYHEWYVNRGNTPHHTERWPIIVTDGQIDDGWHRLHSYIRAGDDVIPVVEIHAAEIKHADHDQSDHGNWARDPKEVGKGFSWDPFHAMPPETPTEVAVSDLLEASLHVRRDERDPARGGHASPVFDQVLDAWAPEHGMDLTDTDVGFVPPDERRWSLTGEQYLDALGRSLLAVGQQEPIRLKWDAERGEWWVAEGNHRLAAAARVGIETLTVVRNKRGDRETKHADHDQRTHGNWARTSAPETLRQRTERIGRLAQDTREVVQGGDYGAWKRVYASLPADERDDFDVRFRHPERTDEEHIAIVEKNRRERDYANQMYVEGAEWNERVENWDSPAPTSLFVGEGRDVHEGEAFLSDTLVSVRRSDLGIEGVIFVTDDKGNRATVRRSHGGSREYAVEEFGRLMGFEKILGRGYLRADHRDLPEGTTQAQTGAGDVTHVREFTPGETVAFLKETKGSDPDHPLFGYGTEEERRMLTQLDYLTGNTDRHLNNILVREDGSLQAIDNNTRMETWHRKPWHDDDESTLASIDWDRADRALDAVEHILLMEPFGHGEKAVDRARRRIADGRRRWGS